MSKSDTRTLTVSLRSDSGPCRWRGTSSRRGSRFSTTRLRRPIAFSPTTSRFPHRSECGAVATPPEGVVAEVVHVKSGRALTTDLRGKFALTDERMRGRSSGNW